MGVGSGGGGGIADTTVKMLLINKIANVKIIIEKIYFINSN